MLFTKTKEPTYLTTLFPHLLLQHCSSETCRINLQKAIFALCICIYSPYARITTSHNVSQQTEVSRSCFCSVSYKSATLAFIASSRLRNTTVTAWCHLRPKGAYNIKWLNCCYIFLQWWWKQGVVVKRHWIIKNALCTNLNIPQLWLSIQKHGKMLHKDSLWNV